MADIVITAVVPMALTILLAGALVLAALWLAEPAGAVAGDGVCEDYTESAPCTTSGYRMEVVTIDNTTRQAVQAGLFLGSAYFVFKVGRSG